MRRNNMEALLRPSKPAGGGSVWLGGLFERPSLRTPEFRSRLKLHLLMFLKMKLNLNIKSFHV